MIKYTATHGPIDKRFASQQIMGWQLWCDAGVEGRDPYPIALCNSGVTATLIAAALNYAISNEATLDLRQALNPLAPV